MPSLSNAFRIFNFSKSGDNCSSDPEPYVPLSVEIFTASVIVVLALIGALIVVVNSLVISMVYKKKTLRSFTNLFLGSLALSDLVTGLMGVPLLLVCMNMIRADICISSVILFRFTGISSVCHVLLIASDRYFAIVHPYRRASHMTKRRAICAICLVWVFACLSSAIQLSWDNLNFGDASEFEESVDINIGYSIICLVLFFLVPLLLMCFIYGRIFYISFKIAKNDRHLQDALHRGSRAVHREWRGRSVLVIMVVIFAGCWLPFFLAMLNDHSNETDPTPSLIWVQRLLSVLGFIPPLTNPLLCTLAKKDFRQVLRGMIFKYKCRQKYRERAHDPLHHYAAHSSQSESIIKTTTL
ncbi:beta-2 adrenergic receptor-like [Montipora foliosa]|uniref:beta-2 adrenergic receptor-like n=1 Tax=Montipora foliosa TaxID=591990 RepID=UPI0035F1322A